MSALRLRHDLAVIALTLPRIAFAAGEPARAEAAAAMRAAPLTVEAAVNEALSRNPSLLEARERLDEVRALRTQARVQALPQVTGEASTTRDRDPGLLNSPNFDRLAETPGFDASFLEPIPVTSYEYKLNLDQLIYSFGKVSAGLEAIRLEELGADATAMARALDVARDVAIAWYDVALADARLDVLDAEERSRLRQVTQARDFLEIGAGTRLQLLQAEAGLANVRPRILEAEGARRASRARLNRLLGREPLAPLEIDVSALATMELGGLEDEDGLVRKIERRPEIVALDLQLRSLEMQMKVIRADRYPSLRFSGSYGIRTIDTENLTDTDYSSWSAGVYVSLPIYDSGDRRAQIEELASQKRQAALRREARIGELGEDLVTGISAYRSARGAAEAAVVAEQRAEESQRVALEEFRLGAATVLDTLEAERTLTEARLQKLEARRDALAALAIVETLAGDWPGGSGNHGGEE
jgi:multidrug efflux system outer membrane protein